MSYDAHSNFAYAAVATAPSPALSGTSLVVDSGKGALFPAAPFNATVWPAGLAPLASNAEIVRVTVVVGDTLTITRAQEGTSARTILVGDQFAATITAKVITDIESGAVNLSFSNANGVTFGVAGSTVTASVATNYLTTARGSTDAIGLNTANSNVTWTANSSGLSMDARGYAGTGTSATNASVTLNSNGLAISVASAAGNVSVQGSTGDISFSNSNNVSFGFNASTITATASFSQTVQTQNLHNVTLAGNTAGVLAQVSSGTLTIAGGNNITVSQAGNAITISGANAGGAQTGISGIVVSDTTYTSGTVSFSGNNITIASSVNGATQYIKLSGVAAQTTQSAIEGWGVSNTGNTAGNTGISTGIDWVLAGSGSITLSQSTAAGTNTVWIQHPAWITTQSGQAFSADAMSNFQTLVFQDSNGVSFSNNAGSLRVTHDLQYTSATSDITSAAVHTSAALIRAIIGSDATYTSGSVGFRDLNGITWQSTTGQSFQITHALQYTSATSAITSAALHTSSPRVFNVIAATDNTGGGTASLSSDVSFSAANGLTFYTSAGNAIVGSHNAITTARRSTDAIGLNTAQTNVTWTVNSSGISINAGGYAGTVTGATGASLTVNTSGVSINLPAYLTTADLSANSSKYVQEWALTGNTAGTTSSAQGTRLYFSGGNSLTISGNSNTLVFSVGNYLTTAALSQDSSKYAGTGFTSAGAAIGLSGTLSTNGLSLSATVAAQTNQSAIKALGVSNTGQTAGNTGLSTGIDWVLAGSQSITLSQSTTAGGPNTIWFQHPAWLTTARASTDAVGLNTAQTNVTWTVNSSGLSLNAGGYAGTVTGATGASLTVNTSGVSINLPAYLTTADLSANSSKYAQEWALTGNTAGTTSSAQGTRWYLSGGNSLTISGNSNSLVFSVGNYITTARASTDAVGLNTAKTNVTWTVNSSGLSIDAGGYAGTVTGATGASLTVNTSGVSINLPAYLTTADLSANSSKYAQEWALTGNTAGTTSSAQGTRWYLSGGNSITISGNSNSFVFSVGNYLTTARASTDAIGLNTAKTNVTWTANSSGLSLDAGGYAGTVSGATGASVTVNTAGVSVNVPATISGYALGQTTGQSSSSTNGFSNLSFSGVGNVSLGYSAGALVISGGSAAVGAVNFSAGTTSSGLGSVVFGNSNGVSFGLNASTITATVSTYDTVGTATTVNSVASANSVGTVTRWAAEDHRHAGVGGIGISTSGNTAGTTGSVLGTYWFQGGQNLTVSQITSNNGSHTLVLSAGSYGTSATNASLTFNSNGLAVNVPGTTQSFYANLDDLGGMATGASAITQTTGASLFIQPFVVRNQLSAGFVRLLASFNDNGVGTAGTTSNAQTYSAQRYTTVGMVIYTQGVGASSRSIQSLSSTSAGITGATAYGGGANGSRYTMSLSKIFAATGGALQTYTTSYAVSSASIVISSDSNTLFTGPRFFDISWAGSLGPGNYWIGIGQSTSSSSNSSHISFCGTIPMAMSLNGVSQTALSFGLFGALTSASDHQLQPGLGVWTTNANIFSKDSIALSQVSQVASNIQLPFQIIRSA